VTDEFPRPYAQEPPAAESLSGLRLLRARPWAVAAAVLLTGAVLAAYPLAARALLDSYVFNNEPVFFFVLMPAFAAIGAVPTVVPLTLVAVLMRRRVTAGRALGLLAASAIVVGTHGVVLQLVARDVVADGELPMRALSAGLDLMVLLVVGLLGVTIYPPVTGRDDIRALVLGSVAMALISAVQSWAGVPGPDPAVWSWVVVGAFTGVGWAIAVLVTSRPAAPAWAVTPAEQGRQDP
jgi:hypothetical protein